MKLFLHYRIWYKGKSVGALYNKAPQVLLNPNELSPDGTISIQSVFFPKNGELLAYTLSKSGSDWSEVHVRNVSSSKDFPEVLRFTNMPSIQWTQDNLGFFYTVKTRKRKEIFLMFF
jgi:prolyl oligopeptidase PreP (S9A serine peptidase family)